MSSEQQSVNLPWVEKYRPSALQELISHEDIIRTIRKFITEDKLPHLLFYGPVSILYLLEEDTYLFLPIYFIEIQFFISLEQERLALSLLAQKRYILPKNSIQWFWN